MSILRRRPELFKEGLENVLDFLMENRQNARMEFINLSPIKRILTAGALATIIFALVAPQAQAFLPLSATGPNTRGDGRQAPNAPLSTYMIDDGTSENGVGLTNGGTLICLNSFAVTAGQNMITSISIAWGTPAFPNPTLNGVTYTAVLWSDPNGDGSPTDAVVLAMAPGVIAGSDTNTFIISPIAPTTVTTPNFFVGFVITHTSTQRPAAFDQTAPTLAGRSWVDAGGNINNLAGAITIESAGLVGNWLIRADAVPEPSTFALVGLGLVGIACWRRRARK